MSAANRKQLGFEDKLLARLDRLDREQLRSYLQRQWSQKQFLLGIFDHLDEGVVVTDAELQLQFLNNRARVMLGWPRGRRNLIGEDLGALLGTDHVLAKTIGSLRGRPREIEGYECFWGPGDERTLALSTLVMHGPVERHKSRDDDKDAQGASDERLLIILLRDMTDRRKRQDEEARARRLASMATLTSGIAHEIKNPLNSLNIHAQLLREEVQRARERRAGPDLQRTERASQVIMEESLRLSRIIDDFLQAARPTSPNLEPRDLKETFERLERIFRPECEAHGIAFTLDVAADLPPVMFDEHLIVQALRNLIGNAIEALHEKLEQARERHEAFVPRVQIQAQVRGDAVQISVADNGPGIAEEASDQIFEPYFTTKFGGTGLGLMVVYRIVTEHRGAIHVETEPDEGTRFVIALPLHQRPVRLLEEEPEPRPEFKPHDIGTIP